MNTSPNERVNIIAALYRWIAQRPGLEFGNYGNVPAYRSELRSITKDLHHARTLIRAVELSSISAEDITRAFHRAFSGRLTWNGIALEYCTGQYWPTEYRRAVCAVMASALWEHKREHCMPAPTYKHYGSATDHPMQTVALYDGKRAGDWLRAKFRQQFGRGIASRFFN